VKKALAENPKFFAEEPPLKVGEDSVIRVADTRVTLDSIVAAFERGDTPEEISRNYDALSLSEVYRAIGYYLSHKTELDAYLEEREETRKAIRKEVEARHNPDGIRARLLARKLNAQ
jgi:uncharacterized protein (DUF433 family)